MGTFLRAFLLGIAATIAVLVIGAFAFIASGTYPIGADVPHAALTETLIDRLRESSIERASEGVQVPADLASPARIAAGAHHYAEDCSGCHGSPGRRDPEIRAGLYPKPPLLAEHGVDDPAEAFWIVKHGIKMTAMPAWGRTHDDEELWSIVAFVGAMPKMTPAQYRAAAESAGKPDDD